MKQSLCKRVEKQLKNNPSTKDWMTFWENLGVNK